MILKVLLNKIFVLKILLAKPTTTDLILTNSSTYFQKERNILIGLSDFHKLVFRILKINFPLEISYISCKHFDEVGFKKDLKTAVALQNN